MKNLKTLSKKKEKISHSDLMFMTKMIALEFNKELSNREMAVKIKEIFKVNCSEKDIESFIKEHRLQEDHELENRKIMEYGSSIGY